MVYGLSRAPLSVTLRFAVAVLPATAATGAHRHSCGGRHQKEKKSLSREEKKPGFKHGCVQGRALNGRVELGVAW